MPNAQMLKCSNAQMLKCHMPNAQMHKHQMLKCQMPNATSQWQHEHIGICWPCSWLLWASYNNPDAFVVFLLSSFPCCPQSGTGTVITFVLLLLFVFFCFCFCLFVYYYFLLVLVLLVAVVFFLFYFIFLVLVLLVAMVVLCVVVPYPSVRPSDRSSDRHTLQQMMREIVPACRVFTAWTRNNLGYWLGKTKILKRTRFWCQF